MRAGTEICAVFYMFLSSNRMRSPTAASVSAHDARIARCVLGELEARAVIGRSVSRDWDDGIGRSRVVQGVFVGRQRW